MATTDLAVPATGTLLAIVVTRHLGTDVGTSMVMPSGFNATKEQASIEEQIAKGNLEQALLLAKGGVERCGTESSQEAVLSQMTLSRVCMVNKESKLALAAAEKSLSMSRELGEAGDEIGGGWEGQALLTKAEVFRESRDLEMAQTVLEEALAMFEEEADKHHCAVAANLLSSVLLRRGEIQEGLDIALKGQEYVREDDDKEQLEITLLSVCQAHTAREEYTEAIQAATEALELAQQTGHRLGEANALSTLASIHHQQDDFSKALEVAKQMRTVCHDIKIYNGEACALLEISAIHLSDHDGKMAVRAASAAVKLCKKKWQQGMQVPALLKLAEGHLQLLGDYSYAAIESKKLKRDIVNSATRAYEAVTEAVTIAEKMGDLHMCAQAEHMNARVLLVIDEADRGLAAAQEATFIFHKLGNEKKEVEALLVTAQCFHKINSAKNWAANAAFDALDIAKKLKDEELEETCAKVMTDIGIYMRASGVTPEMMAMMQSQAPAGGEVAAAGGAQSAIVEAKPKGLDPEEVAATVQAIAREAIGIDEGLYLDSPLMDSGMDSLTAVSFRNTLQQTLAVKLPSSLMFDYPTMKEVANRIVELSNDE
mmetsp:Transcript_56085/g.120804  ORF Transcript_56085/g.120804 Transcript_56085/m.120804 type:complete len:598 (+) Transcript_56085:49-1842(+)